MARKSKLGKPKHYWKKRAKDFGDNPKYSKLDREKHSKGEWWEYSYRKKKRKLKKLL
jgi:uncharacterized membrane protein